jgi:hypothetical protein
MRRSSASRYCERTPDRNGFHGDGIVDAGAIGAER